MDARLSTTLDVLQSLMAAIGEEVVEAGVVTPSSLSDLERSIERQHHSALDLAALSQACRILIRRGSQL